MQRLSAILSPRIDDVNLNRGIGSRNFDVLPAEDGIQAFD